MGPTSLPSPPPPCGKWIGPLVCRHAGQGPWGAVTRLFDSGALSLTGNAHAGEGSRGGTTTSPPATMAKTLDLALVGGG
jgi:hypothetical protein